jgi:Kef-type K+ transport system membrane component KefB
MPVAFVLGVAASLSGPVLTYAAPDHLPETILVTVLCGGISLFLYAPLIVPSGSALPFLIGVGGACGVALLWGETLVRVEPSMKSDASLVVLLLSMFVLLPWTSALLGHSLFLTALLAGLLASLRSGIQPRLKRIIAPIAPGAGALLLAAFGMQIAAERLPELPKEVWGIAAIYLGAMIGGKLLGGALSRWKGHPYGRLAGIALLPQGLLLLEIDTQISRRADLFGGSEDTIHAVLSIAALVGSLALPLLDHLLRRVTMTSHDV